jgi:hypothetical protein
VNGLLPKSFKYHEDGTGCWIWDGYCDPNGYGRIYNRDRKRIEWAHRFSYEAHKGHLPAGFEVDHVCQQTNCVNPGHLDAVTKAEHNQRTMDRLGKSQKHLTAARLRSEGLTYAAIAIALGYATRSAARDAVQSAVEKGLVDAGELPKVRRLNEADRTGIRELYAAGFSQRSIAALYGVHCSQVSRVCSGRSKGRAA